MACVIYYTKHFLAVEGLSRLRRPREPKAQLRFRQIMFVYLYRLTPHGSDGCHKQLLIIVSTVQLQKLA